MTNNRNNKGGNSAYRNNKSNPDYEKLIPVPFLANDKPVWANYLNMARQNIYITLCHITRVLGLPLTESSNLEATLMQIPVITLLNKDNGKAEQKEKAIRMLDKHFPFLTPMVEKYIMLTCKDRQSKDKTPKVYYEVFSIILPLINLLRNKYTHYRLEDKMLDNKENIIDKSILKNMAILSQLLSYCFVGATRITKERFGAKSNAEGGTLNERDFYFLNGLTPRENPWRYYQAYKKDKEGNTIKTRKPNGQEIATKMTYERADFKYAIYNLKDANGMPLKERRLTNVGLLMLVCLFLEKRYASEFADQTEFFTRRNTKTYKPEQSEVTIMREIISVYRMRLPKERMQSTRDNSALGLDMLNELKKCPRPLFDTLSPADQNLFRVAVTENENTQNDETIENGMMLMLRRTDRFPSLALRFIDTNQVFKSIRFQVHLGNYRYKFYEKKWIDGNDGKDRVRILQKELNGFGRLDEIEVTRNNKWGDLIRKIDQPREDTFETAPYVTDHHATYLFNNNRIGLLWNTQDHIALSNGIYLPSLLEKNRILSEDEKLKDLKDQHGNGIAECVEPMCWLSVYDIPAAIFLIHLLHKNGQTFESAGKTVEDIIKATYNNYQQFLKGIAGGTITSMDDLQTQGIGIKPCDIPVKLREYLNGKQTNIKEDFVYLGYERLLDMYERNEKRLERFQRDNDTYGSKENKIGKKAYIDIRPGTLARHIADDIMFFVPTDKNNNKVRITGQNFNIMQAAIAQYTGNIVQLRTLLQKGEIINCERQHPFMHKVLATKPCSFAALYTAYLKAKRAYLANLIKEYQKARKKTNDIKTLKKQFVKDYSKLAALSFLHVDRQKWAERNEDYYKQLAERYATIELPHGIFLNAIHDAIMQLPESKNMDIDKEKDNVSGLILKYFKASGDASQPFYGNKFKRNYKYLDMMVKPEWSYSGPQPSLEKHYYSISEMANMQKQWGQTKELREKRVAVYAKAVDKKTNHLLEKARAKFGNDIRKLERREKSIQRECNEEKKAAIEKLQHCRTSYSANEREIRRYKVQDILIFLMAIDHLTAAMGTKGNFSSYKLRNIGCASESSDILSMLMPFSMTLEIPSLIKDEPAKVITIKQDDLKLKNYGDFFRFIYDRRIRTLLQNVKENEFTRQQIEEELECYNRMRIPVFKQVLSTEEKIWKQLPSEQLHKKADDKEHPVNIDFKYLMQFVNIKESNIEIIKAIRNAFSHNQYPTDSAVARLVFDKKQIPELAKEITKLLHNKTNQINLKDMEDKQ